MVVTFSSPITADQTTSVLNSFSTGLLPNIQYPTVLDAVPDFLNWINEHDVQNPILGDDFFEAYANLSDTKWKGQTIDQLLPTMLTEIQTCKDNCLKVCDENDVTYGEIKKVLEDLHPHASWKEVQNLQGVLKVLRERHAEFSMYLTSLQKTRNDEIEKFIQINDELVRCRTNIQERDSAIQLLEQEKRILDVYREGFEKLFGPSDRLCQNFESCERFVFQKISQLMEERHRFQSLVEPLTNSLKDLEVVLQDVPEGREFLQKLEVFNTEELTIKRLENLTSLLDVPKRLIQENIEKEIMKMHAAVLQLHKKQQELQKQNHAIEIQKEREVEDAHVLIKRLGYLLSFIHSIFVSDSELYMSEESRFVFQNFITIVNESMYQNLRDASGHELTEQLKSIWGDIEKEFRKSMQDNLNFNKYMKELTRVTVNPIDHTQIVMEMTPQKFDEMIQFLNASIRRLDNSKEILEKYPTSSYKDYLLSLIDLLRNIFSTGYGIFSHVGEYDSEIVDHLSQWFIVYMEDYVGNLPQFDKEEMFEDIEDNVPSFMEEQDDLNQQLEQCQQELTETKAFFETNQDLLNETRGKLELVDAQYKDLQKTYDELVDKKHKLASLNDKLHLRIFESSVEHKNTIDRMIKEIEQEKNQRLQSDTNISAISSQIEGKVKRIETLEKERDEALRKIEILSNEQQLVNDSLRQSEETQTTLESQLGSVNERFAILERERIDLTNTLQEVSQKLRKAEEQAKQLKGTKHSLEQANKDISFLKETIIGLRKDQVEIEEDYEANQKSMDELQSKHQQILQERDELLRLQKSTQEELQQLQMRHQEFQDDYQTLSTRTRQDVQSLNDVVEMETQKLKHEYKSAIQQLENFKALECQHNEKVIETLKEELSLSRDEKEEMSAKLEVFRKQADIQISNLEHQLEVLERQKEDMGRETFNLHEKANSLEEQNVSIKEKLDADINLLIDKYTTEIEKLETSLQSTKTENQKLATDIDRLTNEQNEKIKQLENSLQEAQNEKETLNAQLLQLTNESRNHIIELEKLIENEKTRYTEEMNQLNQHIKEAYNEKKQLSEQLVRLQERTDKRISDLLSQLSRQKTVRSEITSARDESVSKVSELQNEKDALEAKIELLKKGFENQIKEFEKEAFQLRNAELTRRTTLENKIGQLEKEYSDKQNELEDSLNKKQIEITNLQETIVQLQEESTNRQATLAKASEFVDTQKIQYEKEIGKLRTDLEKANQTLQSVKDENENEISQIKQSFNEQLDASSELIENKQQQFETQMTQLRNTFLERISELENEIAILQANSAEQIKKLESFAQLTKTEKEKLENEIKLRAQSIEAINKLETSKKIALSDKEQLENSLKLLKEEQETLIDSLKAVTEEKDGLDETLKQVRQNLDKTIKELENTVQESTFQNEKFEEEKIQLLSRIDELTNLLQEETKTSDTLKQELQKAQINKESLQEKLIQIENSSGKKTTELQNDLVRMKAKRTEITQERDNLMSQMKDLQNSLISEQTKKNKLQQELSEKIAEAAKEQALKNEHAEEVEQMIITTNNLRKLHNDEIQSLVSKHEKESQALRDKHAEEVEQLRITTNNLQKIHDDEIQSLVSKHEKESQALRDKHAEEVEQMRITTNNLRKLYDDEIQNLTSKHEKELSQLKERNLTLEKEIYNLKQTQENEIAMRDRHTGQIADLQKKLLQTENKQKEMERKHNNAKKKIGDLENLLKKEQTKKVELEKELKTLRKTSQAQIASLQETITKIQDVEETLKNQLVQSSEDATRRIDELSQSLILTQAQKDKIDQENSQLQIEVSEANARIKALDNELLGVQSEKEQAEKKIDDLKQTLSNLQITLKTFQTDKENYELQKIENEQKLSEIQRQLVTTQELLVTQEATIKTQLQKEFDVTLVQVKTNCKTRLDELEERFNRLTAEKTSLETLLNATQVELEQTQTQLAQIDRQLQFTQKEVEIIEHFYPSLHSFLLQVRQNVTNTVDLPSWDAFTRQFSTSLETEYKQQIANLQAEINESSETIKNNQQKNKRRRLKLFQVINQGKKLVDDSFVTDLPFDSKTSFDNLVSFLKSLFDYFKSYFNILYQRGSFIGIVETIFFSQDAHYEKIDEILTQVARLQNNPPSSDVTLSKLLIETLEKSLAVDHPFRLAGSVSEKLTYLQNVIQEFKEKLQLLTRLNQIVAGRNHSISLLEFAKQLSEAKENELRELLDLFVRNFAEIKAIRQLVPTTSDVRFETTYYINPPLSESDRTRLKNTLPDVLQTLLEPHEQEIRKRQKRLNEEREQSSVRPTTPLIPIQPQTPPVKRIRSNENSQQDQIPQPVVSQAGGETVKRTQPDISTPVSELTSVKKIRPDITASTSESVPVSESMNAEAAIDPTSKTVLRRIRPVESTINRTDQESTTEPIRQPIPKPVKKSVEAPVKTNKRDRSRSPVKTVTQKTSQDPQPATDSSVDV